MVSIPRVVQATHAGGHRIRILFDDGTASTIDFSQWLVGPVFEPLKDEAYFKRFYIDGDTVAWPNGADIAPETLYSAPGRTG